MIPKVLFVSILFLTACGYIKSTPENNTVGTIHDSVKDTVITNAFKSLPDSSINRKKADTAFNCEVALHELVNSSSYDQEVKKFGFKVFVDSVSAGFATLKITMKNEERNEDLAIGWLKMDFNKKQLLDITIDPDKPEELKYDSILFKKIIKSCRNY